MKADFHCHTSCSDGELSPQALLEKAMECGLQALAITDHDSIAAYRDWQKLCAALAVTGQSFTLYSGVELSSQWAGQEIHLVGLGFDLDNHNLQVLLGEQDQRREQRAQAMAAKLEKKGARDILNHAREFAGEAALCRPHFARALIEQGLVSSQKHAFDRYLGQGKSCYQACEWPDFATTVAAIRDAGGVAVLAHPTRYRMTASKLRRMVKDFAEHGGQGLEFLGGSGSKDHQAFLKALCLQHALLASPASDFHSEQQLWQQLGKTGDLPEELGAVWELMTPLQSF